MCRKNCYTQQISSSPVDITASHHGSSRRPPARGSRKAPPRSAQQPPAARPHPVAGQQLLATALPQGAAVAPRPGSADACTAGATSSSMRHHKREALSARRRHAPRTKKEENFLPQAPRGVSPKHTEDIFGSAKKLFGRFAGSIKTCRFNRFLAVQLHGRSFKRTGPVEALVQCCGPTAGLVRS